MKQYFKTLVSLFLLTCALNPFSKADTIENFQIYIDDKLLLTEENFNPLRSTSPFLKLDSSDYSKYLIIYFNRCTSGSTNREIKLIDSLDKIFFIWKFGNKDESPAMKIPIAQILNNSQIKSNSHLKLLYKDQEYQFWSFLTSVNIGVKKTENNSPINSSRSLNSIHFIYILLFIVALYIIFRNIKRESPNR